MFRIGELKDNWKYNIKKEENNKFLIYGSDGYAIYTDWFNLNDFEKIDINNKQIILHLKKDTFQYTYDKKRYMTLECTENNIKALVKSLEKN